MYKVGDRVTFTIYDNTSKGIIVAQPAKIDPGRYYRIQIMGSHVEGKSNLGRTVFINKKFIKLDKNQIILDRINTYLDSTS